MVIKFKNGYTVRATDTAGKTKKEIFEIAKRAVETLKDAELKKNIDTNISFKPIKMAEAMKNDDKEALEREVAFLKRDLEADATKHANYPAVYRKDVIDALLKQYDKAIDMLWDYKPFDNRRVLELYDLLLTIKENWKRNPYIVDLGDKKKTVFDIEEAKEYVDIANRGTVINGSTGEVVYMLGDSIAKDSCKATKDSIEKKFIVLIKAFGKLLYLAADGELTSREENAERFDFEKDAYEAAKAATNNAPNSYHIIAIDANELEVGDSQKIKDVPEFDPTDYPKIESEYSTERLTKELRHPSAEENLADLFAVIDEIDEFVGQGPQALINAGWDKLDARHAIKNRYFPLVKALREAGKKDLAKKLLAKIHELEKAWDLNK